MFKQRIAHQADEEILASRRALGLNLKIENIKKKLKKAFKKKMPPTKPVRIFVVNNGIVRPLIKNK